IAGDDVEISAHFHTAHAYGVYHIGGIIHGIILRNNVNNLITRRNVCPVLIPYQLVNIIFVYFALRMGAYAVASCLQAFDMLAGNAYIHFFELQMWIGLCTFFNGLLNSLDTLLNVHHHTMTYPCGFCLAEAEDFQLAKFIFPPGYGYHLSSAYVETDDDGLFFFGHIV